MSTRSSSVCRLMASTTLIALTLNTIAWADPTLKQIDVSGDRGQDGRHGSNGSDGGWNGGDGSDGSDATDPTRGQDAGDISIELSTPMQAGKPLHGTVQLNGVIRTPRGGQNDVRSSIEFGTSGHILLEAQGGDGGNGANGGDGGDGGKGRDGDNATQHSRGTDGGRGGDGGDGGDGTSGADAGRGGRVVVKFNHQDTHLLMLVRRNNDGGRGGRAGQNGRGGSAGRGGDGGNSYTWTEYYTVTKSRQVSETDSEGNTTYSTETYEDTESRTHTTPGGSDGYSGSSGRSGNATLRDGRDGEDGQFIIQVSEPDGRISEYTRAYSLALQGYEMESANRNGVIEPGEQVEIRNITVRNTGGMPTPSSAEVLIFVETNGWVVSEGMVLKIDRSLQPGESYTLENQTLTFRVRDTHIQSPGERFRAQSSVSPVAKLDHVNRYFGTFERQTGFEVTFPIEITPITALDSMGPGQKTQMWFRVKNISTRALGKLSDLKREIGIQFKHEGGELPASSVNFTDAEGQPHGLENGFFKAIENLGPGEETLIQGVIGLNSDAPFYTDAKLQAELSMGPSANPSERRTVQKREFTIRVAQAYVKTPGSNILLIVNHATQRDEVQAWKAMLGRMGLEADIWDLSLNGFLDLSRTLDSGSTLLKDFKGGTVILLNNEFETAALKPRDGNVLRGLYFLAKTQFLQAAAANGTHFYVVGGAAKDQRSLLGDFLVPTDVTHTTDYASPKDFLKRLKEKFVDNQNAEEIDFRVVLEDQESADYLVPAETIQVEGAHIFMKPKPEYLEARAKKLASKLEIAYPDLRFVTIHHFSPKRKEKRWLGVFPHWDYGTIEVRQTLDSNVASAVAIEAGSEEVHTSRFINSHENHVGLFLAMTFDQKLEMLDRLFNHQLELQYAEISQDPTPGAKPSLTLNEAAGLVDAILVNLADEQSALRAHRWKSGITRDDVLKRLPLLQKLAEHSFPPMVAVDSKTQDPSGLLKLMTRLMTGIEFLARSQKSWFDLGIFGRRDALVTAVSLEFSRILQLHLLNTLSEGDPLVAQEKLKTQVTQMLETLKEKKKQWGLNKKDAGLRMLFAPALDNGVSLDTPASLDTPKVLSGAQVEDYRMAEKERKRLRDGLEHAMNEARRKLSVGPSCDELLQGPGPVQRIEAEAPAPSTPAETSGPSPWKSDKDLSY